MRMIYQNEVAECGYACLAMVLSATGKVSEAEAEYRQAMVADRRLVLRLHVERFYGQPPVS